MERLTLVVVLALAFIGISLTVSSIATDGSLAQAHERKRFRADLQTTTRLVDPPPGRCVDQHGSSPVVGLLEVVGAGDATFFGPVVDEQSHCVRADGSFFGGVLSLRMRTATLSGDGTLDTWNRPSIPHFHHRLQAARGSSSETPASAEVASATSTTTVRLITMSRHGASPICPLGTRRFSSTRQSGSIESQAAVFGGRFSWNKESDWTNSGSTEEK